MAGQHGETASIRWKIDCKPVNDRTPRRSGGAHAMRGCAYRLATDIARTGFGVTVGSIDTGHPVASGG
jgi:hypothetical protein